MTKRVYLLLGSNEGERAAFLQHAIADIQATAATGTVEQSSVYETAAWGIEEQPPFLNIAIGFDTSLSPEALLRTTWDIEAKYGRQRTLVWGQRTLDIDILFYGDEIIRLSHLTIPHPQLANRRFALTPLCELAPDFIHPELNLSCEALLRQCSDPLAVTRFRLQSG